MNNPIVLFGYTSELLLIIALSYVEGLNLVFGTRDVLFIHFGVCCLPFGAVMIFWNEFRKYMVLNNNILRFVIQNHQSLRCQVGGLDV